MKFAFLVGVEFLPFILVKQNITKKTNPISPFFIFKIASNAEEAESIFRSVSTIFKFSSMFLFLVTFTRSTPNVIVLALWFRGL